MNLSLPRCILAFATCLLAACGTGGPPVDGTANALFPPDALREDLAYLRQAHALRHPRRHQAPPDAALEDAFATAHLALDRPMTRAEAFRHIARVNPAFRDAHTLVMPLLGEVDGNDPAQARFPLAVRLDADGDLRVRGDWTRGRDGHVVRDGAQITHINEVPVPALLDRLAAYGHGETPLLRRHMLGLMFRHWLHAVEGWAGDFTLAGIDGGHSWQLQLRGSDSWTASGPASLDAPSLGFLSARTALLRLPTFDIDDAPEAYASAIDAAFDRLRERRPQGLVIDVRGNTGGQSDAGAQVIRRLIARPVLQGSRAWERLNEDNNGVFGYRGSPGTVVEMDVSRDGRIDPAPEHERIQARVVLLVDAMTYSAGILFATTLQDNGLAILVGQPTGGFGNQTGNMDAVSLPNTGLLAYIPSREFVRPNGDGRLAPVMPDFVVSPAPGDAGDDAALDCARALLEQPAGDATAPEACQARAATP